MTPLENLTTLQQVRVAILAAKKVCDDEDWNIWADAWLSGEDRSARAADAAARAHPQALAAWEVARTAAAVADTAARADRAVKYALEADPTIDLDAIIKQALEE